MDCCWLLLTFSDVTYFVPDQEQNLTNKFLFIAIPIHVLIHLGTRPLGPCAFKDLEKPMGQ